MFLITNINDDVLGEKRFKGYCKMDSSSKYSGYFTPVFHMC